VAELDNKPHLQLHPNPADNYLSVVLPQFSGTGNEVRIYDHTGSIVLNRRLSLHNQQAIIELSGIRPGMYFIELINDHQQYLSKFFKR
jgi:hypothetical protein